MSLALAVSLRWRSSPATGASIFVVFSHHIATQDIGSETGGRDSTVM
jgi:hypothetical protein